MVSTATPKFKQRQQRTNNKLLLLRNPITCLNLLGVRMRERVRGGFVYLTIYGGSFLFLLCFTKQYF